MANYFCCSGVVVVCGLSVWEAGAGVCEDGGYVRKITSVYPSLFSTLLWDV